MWMVLALLAMGLGCSEEPPEQWSTAVRVVFVDACIEVHEDAPPWLWLRMGVYEVTSRDLCRCTLYKMESQYTEGDAALLAGDEKSDAGKEAMVSCREEMLYD